MSWVYKINKTITHEFVVQNFTTVAFRRGLNRYRTANADANVGIGMTSGPHHSLPLSLHLSLS